MANSLRAAVIGLGHLGKHHARVLSELENVDLVAVVDVDGERAQEFGERFHCEALTDYTKLKNKIDVACVVVPTVNHFEVASWLFENGIHALVEKPLALTVKEAEELSKKAEKAGVILQVGHIERYNPALRTIRKQLDAVTFIESHRLSPYPFRSTDIGVIMDVMIHDLDIILDLVNSPVAEIRANATPVISRGHEDIANARIQFESGAIANITASRISDKVARKMRMFCPSKYINLDFAAKQAWIYEKSAKFDDPNFRVEEVDVAGVENLMQFVFRDLIHVEQVAIDEIEPLKAELQDFVECVSQARSPEVSGEDAVKAISLAQDIVRECKEYTERYGMLERIWGEKH